jgi:hypothetical protein
MQIALLGVVTPFGTHIDNPAPFFQPKVKAGIDRHVTHIVTACL